jgi:glycosyltransferase involved in cell wall biosynthesis
MVCTFVFGVFYVFVFRGLYLAYRRRRELILPFLFFLAIFYYIASVAGPWGSVVRYRLPAWPGMLIIFSYAVFVVWDNHRMKRENYYQQKNKIVIASGTYLPEVSGQSTFVSGLVKTLSAAGMAWSVVAYGGKKETREDIIFIVPRNAWRYFSYWRVARKQARDAGIIFAQDLVSSGLPAALAKRSGQKLFIRIGGDFIWEKMVNSGRSEVPFSQYYDQPKSRTEKIYLLIYRFVMRRADKIVFNSEWQKGIYCRQFKLPDNKIEIIENFEISDYSESIRLNDHQEENKNITNEIIFAGRFIPLKNLKRLIEAFRQIETDKKLVLIGDGPQKDELEKLAAKDSRISIEPKIGQPLLFDRLSKSYLLVLPSLSEMNPNIALEALGRRKPVLLTKENGLSGDIRKYFKLIDPTSIKEIKESIEYFLNQENYDEYVGSINNKYPTKKFAEYLSIFKNL